MRAILYLVILTSLLSCTRAWDTDELEIFDLVEEVNQNFYELMGLSQDASAKDIKRAFRNLSIYLHPDKSDAEDANVQFRNLVSVYDVLKDSSKREKYNKVLKDGLPNWKSAVYYYRRVRRMGFAESALILFVIITIGQYLVSWGIYIEKKYTAEQLFGSKLKKLQKKNRANVDIDAILEGIPSPSVFNTLPFQIPRAIWNFPKAVKSFLTDLYEYKKQEMEKKRLEAEELERQKQLEEELVKEKEAKKEKRETIRKRKQAQKAPEKTDAELAGYSKLKVKEFNDDDMVKPVKSGKAPVTGGFWSDEDLAELVRLVKKYPGGTTNRWEIIGETMNRSVTEVTFMAAKLKENGYRIPGQTESIAENLVQEGTEIKKIKTKKTANPILVTETNWSQEQQRALEAAIMKYRKTGSTDRWLKIANSVPGKTKEECLVRYKYLVELVKSQKESQKDKDEVDVDGEIKQDEEDVDNIVGDDYVKKEENISEDIETVQYEIENEEIEEQEPKNKGGKPRNKRKERKKRQRFSSDEDNSDY